MGLTRARTSHRSADLARPRCRRLRVRADLLAQLPASTPFSNGGIICPPSGADSASLFFPHGGNGRGTERIRPRGSRDRVC